MGLGKILTNPYAAPELVQSAIKDLQQMDPKDVPSVVAEMNFYMKNKNEDAALIVEKLRSTNLNKK